jgi:hypothetical protein
MNSRSQYRRRVSSACELHHVARQDLFVVGALAFRVALPPLKSCQRRMITSQLLRVETRSAALGVRSSRVQSGSTRARAPRRSQLAPLPVNWASLNAMCAVFLPENESENPVKAGFRVKHG